MACGGGGNVKIGRLRALASLKKNKEIRVIHPGKLVDYINHLNVRK